MNNQDNDINNDSNIMDVYLIGFKGCGKTTVGKKLAEISRKKFIDLDSEIENSYEKKTGKKKTFREIFKETGRDDFSQLETEALKEAAAWHNSVISTGGSTPLKAENRMIMQQSGIIIHLKVKEDILYKRIISDGIPAFFNKDKPRESFNDMIKERKKIYTDLADHIIDNNRSSDKAAEEIIKIISVKHP